MLRGKKERGRPARPYPPRIDAKPGKIANVVLNAKGRRPFGADPKRTDYRCRDCNRLVRYPKTLYQDGCCKECHAARV